MVLNVFIHKKIRMTFSQGGEGGIKKYCLFPQLEA